MKTKLALALAALAVNAQAVSISIIHHNEHMLVFSVDELDVLGYSHVTETVENFPWSSYMDIGAFAQPESVVALTVVWQPSYFARNESFAYQPGMYPIPFYTGASWQPYDNGIAFTYYNPYSDQLHVGDNGNVLVALGAALLGVWRFKR